VVKLKNCYHLDATRCVKLKGTFLETKHTWNYLNINGCCFFDSKKLEKINKLTPESKIHCDIREPNHFVKFRKTPSWKEIFRGHPKKITYDETEKIINDYVDQTTQYIRSLLNDDTFRDYDIDPITKSGLEIILKLLTNGEKSYSKQLFFNNIFRKKSNRECRLYNFSDLYHSVWYHTNDNHNLPIYSTDGSWEQNYSQEKHGSRLDQYINELKTELDDHYTASLIDNHNIISFNNKYIESKNESIDNFINMVMNWRNFGLSRKINYSNNFIDEDQEKWIRKDQLLMEEIKTRPLIFFEKDNPKQYANIDTLLQEKISENNLMKNNPLNNLQKINYFEDPRSFEERLFFLEKKRDFDYGMIDKEKCSLNVVFSL